MLTSSNFTSGKDFMKKNFRVVKMFLFAAVLVFAFSSYPMQIPGFAIAFYFLLAACVVGSSRLQILFFIIMIALLGSYYWKYNQYNACEEWFRYKMHYNIGAFRLAKEGYEKIYPELNDRGAFLFEYGHSLHKLK